MLVSKNFGDIVTFSRASSGWHFSSGGVLVQSAPGVPRFDYDPITLAPQGLLSEQTIQNLCTYSEFPNGVSDAPVRGGIVSAETIDWLGYFTTGLSLGWDGVTGTYAYKSVAVNPSTLYTASAFVKLDDGKAPSFGSPSGADASNDFAMVTGNSTIGPNGFTVEAMRDGVYRVSGTLMTSASPGRNFGIVKYPTNTPRTFKCTGYQITAGAYAGSYMPTLGSQATSAADNAAITDLSKIAFNPNEGAIFIDFVVPRLAAGAGADPGQGVFGFVGSYPSYLFGVGVGSSGAVNLYRTINWTPRPGLGTPNALKVGSVARLGVAWSVSKGDALCLNGGPVVTGSGTSLAGMTELRLGRFAGNPGYLNGRVRAVSVLPVRPDDAAFQARTVL